MNTKVMMWVPILIVWLLSVSCVQADITSGLVGYWAFNGDFTDSSGNANHGQPIGNTAVVTDPERGSVAQFDGAGDYIEIPHSESLNITGDRITLTSWVYFDDVSGGPEIVLAKIVQDGQHVAPYFAYNLCILSNGTPRFFLVTSGSQKRLPGSPNFESRRWYHMAGVYDGSRMILYVDGQVSATMNASGNINGYDTPLFLGINGGRGEPMDGRLDDVLIYNRALTQEELQQVMIGIALGVASNPSPADEATDVPREVVLSWTPGEYAPPVNGHKVYMSENFSDVNDGVGGIANDANSYAPPQRLDFGTNYYWRVDEVNGPPDYTVYQGDVWSFTTEPFAYAIKNIAATASSTQSADMGPENTVNESGLDDNDLHSKNESDMWLSSVAGLQPTWIQYEFDKVYKLHQMWVWNSNQMVEPMVGFGFKDVTIEYSVNGTDYTALGTTHEFARAPGTPGYAHNTTVDFGGLGAKYVRLTANRNWGGILNQYGLSEVRFFHIPVSATKPYPDSGATGVPPDVVLSWAVGREAVTHDVYVSTDEQAVIDGTAPVATVTEASYGPLSLDLDTTHYWKVNEVNEAETLTTWESNIWSFTTTEYLVVDDFESYNDLDPTDPESNRIFNTWIDGYEVPTNGSLVGYENPPFCEQTIVHGGSQSMPFAYSNTGGAAYSEAERTFAVGQDWTKASSRTLVLYFYGDAGNTGQLYAKINGSKVVYGGDAGDIAKVQWQQWNIDLAALNVNLQNVTKLSIGIDDNGVSGTLYLDDIRLYALAP